MSRRSARGSGGSTGGSIARGAGSGSRAKRSPTGAGSSPATGATDSRSTPISPGSKPPTSRQGSTSSQAAPRAPTSRTRKPGGRALGGASPGSSGTSPASVTQSSPSGRCGRTWMALSPPTKVWTSHSSWAPSWAPTSMFQGEGGRAQVWCPDPGAALSGAFSTLNTSGRPNDATASLLSDALVDHAHPRFSLSPRAAAGVLRRATRRRKTLPALLESALRALSALTPDAAGSPDPRSSTGTAPTSPQGSLW